MIPGSFLLSSSLGVAKKIPQDKEQSKGLIKLHTCTALG
jgi:hypothetical protein